MARRLLDRPEIVAHDIVTRAMHRTGSDDFDATSWTEPLEVLTRSLDREARLTIGGRRRARAQLISLLVARRPAIPTKTIAQMECGVAISGPDPEGIAILATALGAASTAVTRPFEMAFTSLAFEVRWHLPSYAEWLTGSDLSDSYLDVARRLAATAGEDRPVIGGIELIEHQAALRAAFPRFTLVEIERDPEASASALTAATVAARRRASNDVDAVKVERYWRWRLGLRAERRAATGFKPTITVRHSDLLADPRAAARLIIEARPSTTRPD